MIDSNRNDVMQNPVCGNCQAMTRQFGDPICGIHNKRVDPHLDTCDEFFCSKDNFCKRYIRDINGKYLNILGHKWEIEVVKFKEHEYLKKHDAEGVTKQYLRKIIISDGTDKDLLNEEERLNRFKHCLRHEIIHAFLSESGLGACSNRNMKPWAKNEEMVDWIAFKSKDIFKVFDSLGLLE